MQHILQKINIKKLTAVILLLVLLLFSVNVLSDLASDPEHHKQTIQELDEKKADVLKLTAVSAAASTALAAIPGDATTPVANKLADLSSYFLVILMVVFLEKYMITLTGYAAFSILIPAACILLAAGICLGKKAWNILAAKMIVFALVLFMLIPFSVKVSVLIEKTYDISIESTMESAEDITEDIDKSRDSDGNILEQALSKLKNGVDGLLEKGENLLNRFIETIAIMLVTSCLIPVLVLLFLAWFVRILFSIQGSQTSIVYKEIRSKLPGQKKDGNVKK